ncbi:hypothetical protein BG004_006092 [Podila humilis]|nr:hypothetical protein BG004_006092 [Podila humilis]
MDDLSELYDDLVLQPRRPRKRQNPPKKPPLASSTPSSVAAMFRRELSDFLLPEILERICYFATQTALRQTIAPVCKSWYLIARPFMRQKGVWSFGSQAAEDALLSRMMSLRTLRIEACYDKNDRLVGRVDPYRELGPSLKRFLKTITDPIGPELPILQNQTHTTDISLRARSATIMAGTKRSKSQLSQLCYQVAEENARKAKLRNQSCLLAFPTSIEFAFCQIPSSLHYFHSILPFCGNIRTLKLIGVRDDCTWDIFLILSHCPALRTFVFCPQSTGYHVRLTVHQELQLQHPFHHLSHFEVIGVRISQATTAAIIESLPFLNYLQIQYQCFQDNSMDLPYLYTHASTNCPYLEFVQIVNSGRGRTDIDQLQLIQQHVPHIRRLSLTCDLSSLWQPDRSTCHFFSQLTHLDIFKPPHGFSMFEYPALDKILRSAPRLIWLRAIHNGVRIYTKTLWKTTSTSITNDATGTGTSRHTRAHRRKIQRERRIEKQVAKNNGQIKDLPHPSSWLCHGLRYAELNLNQELSGPVVEWLVRLCPHLVDLTLGVTMLAMGQRQTIRKIRCTTSSELSTSSSSSSTLIGSKKKKELTNYDNDYLEDDNMIKSKTKKEPYFQDHTIQHENQVVLLTAFSRLERLTLRTNCLVAPMTEESFKWMAERESSTTSRKTPKRSSSIGFTEGYYKCWPRLEYFAVEILQTTDPGTDDDNESHRIQSLIQFMHRIRASVEFRIIEN